MIWWFDLFWGRDAWYNRKENTIFRKTKWKSKFVETSEFWEFIVMLHSKKLNILLSCSRSLITFGMCVMKFIGTSEILPWFKKFLCNDLFLFSGRERHLKHYVDILNSSRTNSSCVYFFLPLVLSADNASTLAIFHFWYHSYAIFSWRLLVVFPFTK